MKHHLKALVALLSLASAALPGQATADAGARDAPLFAIRCAFEDAASNGLEVVGTAATGTEIDYSARVLARLGVPRDLHCSVHPYTGPRSEPAAVVNERVFASVQTLLL
jgi:hypothetical protein